MRAFILASILALAACGQNNAAPPPAAETPASAASTPNALFTYGGGLAPILLPAPDPMAPPVTPPPTWFICDSIDGDDIFIASRPDEGGAFLFAHYNKTTQATQRTSVILSGDMFAAPNGPAQAFTDSGGTLGVIYTLDAARMSAPNAATTAPIIGLDFASEEFNCRYFEHMLFLGFTETQSVVVRRVGEKIELMTFSFTGEGALMVEMEHGEQSTIADISADNGRASDGYNRDDVIQWLFEGVSETASDSFDYHVWTAEEERGVLQRWRGGDFETEEEFRAYALARTEP